MEKTPLLSSLNSSSSFYPGPPSYAADGVRELVDPEPLHYTHAQPTPRASNEVEVVSGAKVHIRIVVDGMELGGKHVKVQVFPESTVMNLFSTIRVEWAIDRNALTLAGGKVMYVDQLVKENGALLLPRYPAALLFSDKSSNTAAIEITYMYERVEKPCCQCSGLFSPPSVFQSLVISVLVAVSVRGRGVLP